MRWRVGGGGGGGGSCSGGSDGGGGGGGSDGGGYVERARGEEIGVTRMQVRVPRIHIGDILAHIKAMRLANVQTFGSQCFASKQSKKEIWLRRSQICPSRH